MRHMSRDERKTREKLYQACCVYNSMQSSEPETLTIGDYYRKLKSRWDGQANTQVDRLAEFEDLDSRWRAAQRQGDGEDGSESDSYRDSDDGSLYGEPPGDW